MKKLAALSLSLFLVSGTAIADTPKNADPHPPNSPHPPKPKPAKQPTKANNEVPKHPVAKEQAEAKKASEDGPSAIKFKGITLTPAGFIAAETVFRSRATSGDINTPFTGIPYPSLALSKVTENNFTARQTRPIVIAETNIVGSQHIGDFPADFPSAS